MKTNKILLNKKALIKATSGFLSFVLTANAGLSLLYENAYAREIDYNVSNNTVTLSSGTGESETFYLMEGEDSYFISDSIENPTHEKDMGAIRNFTINENCTLVVLADFQIEKLVLNGGDEEGTEAVLIIGEDASLTHRLESGTGLNKIINYGRFVGDGFNASMMESQGITAFHNEGEIFGRSAYIDSDIYTDVPNASIKVNDGFTKDNRNINATVEAHSTSTIKSAGGTFTLNVDGDTIEITEPIVDNVDAGTLVKDPEITLDEVPDFLVGENVNFSTYIHTADGYTGTPYIEYSYNGETWSAKAPTSAGDYYIRAVAPGVGTYRQATSSSQSVSLSYLPTSDVINDSSYCTLSGITNDVYIADELIITPPEGYTISCSHDLESYGEDGPIFKESLSLSQDEIEVMPGFINQDVMVSFKRADGATTRDVSIYSVLPKDDEGNTVWNSLVFDTEDPYFRAYIIHNTNLGFTHDEVSIEEANANVYADNLLVSVKDNSLVSVILSVDGVKTDLSGNITDSSTIIIIDDIQDPPKTVCETTLTSTPGKAKQVTVTATDAAGRVATAEFTLYPEEPIDPELEVTLPEAIYVGDEYEPDIETNSDSEEIVFEYFDYDNDTELEEAPTAAGSYMLRVTVGPTDLFKLASYDVDFEILKHDLDVEVSVADINVGGTVSPVLSGVPADYDGTITYEYKLTTAPEEDYSTTKPTAFGAYTVRVTLSETDIYLGTEATDNFAISRNALTATVSVEDLHVGEEISPVVTTDPDDYDGDITYEYKLSTDEDDEYTEDEPTAAGTYTVRATLAATDTYLGITATSTFTISKNDLSASVSVNNISVGETVTPVMADVPDDYDGAITYEYKLSTAEDSAYSTTVPTAAGTYTVRANLAATDVYLSTTATSTFTISKNALTATLSVADINVGETPSPVVTTDAADYNGSITYEYKSTANGAFSSTVPTAAGTYTVRATLAETDKYLSTTCTGTFTINKNTLTATVSVADINVGNTPAPVVTTDPEDYNGTITYEYKLSTDTTYSTDVPTAAGTYNVRATLSETATYLSTTCTGTFTISKNALTASVSVEDIYVGGEVSPEVVFDPGDYNGTITYEYKLSTAENYSSTVPTAAGTYIVRATFAETDVYLSTTATDTFTISKRTARATVTAEDIHVGETVNPLVSSVSGGTYTLEYKLSTASDAEYSTTVPTAAGTYTVRATIAETASYLSTTATDTFTISRNETTATVSVADITVGNEPEPVVSTVSDGKYLATFQYKTAGADDSTYTDTVPTAAGTYTVKASIPETGTYLALTATGTFTISKNVATSEVYVDDIVVGGIIYPDITTNSNGTATVEYKAFDADDSAYSTTLPYVEGKYTVRVTIPETAKYFATSCTSDFTISKSAVTATVYVESIYVGGEVKPVISTVSNGKEDTVFEYKTAGADDSTYTETVPSAAGTYTVRATVPATVEYIEIVCYDSFTIYLNPVAMEKFKIENYYVGQTPDPDFACTSNGDVTFEYKPKNADDSEYTTDEPTKEGIYTARATVAETSVYAAASFITDFRVSYLNAPGTAFTPEGTEGKNGYFKSDVELTAPEGYLISTSENGDYKKSIPYTEGMDTIYLKRDDGAMTSSIAITNKPKIDKVAPEFQPSTAIPQNDVLFTPGITLKIDDQNLKSLTLNGEPVDLSTITDNTLTLSPGWGVLKVDIVAEDIAGNVSRISFTLKAEWLELGTIPADQLVPLDNNTEYNLAKGQWQVIKGNPEDKDFKTEADPTIYNGNMPVYVKEGGDYTVTQVK